MPVDNIIQDKQEQWGNIVDEFHMPTFDKDLANQVMLYEIPHGMEAYSNQDKIFVQLFDETAIHALKSKYFTIDDSAFLTYENGRLKVDTLGLVAAEFGTTYGRYKLKISGFTTLVYDNVLMTDPDNPDEGDYDIGDIEGKDITLGSVEITEIATSRQEIRAKAGASNQKSFETFYKTVTPGYKSDGKYWMFEDTSIDGGTVYFFTNVGKTDYAFTSPEEYNIHRAARGYPEDFTGIEKRNLDGTIITPSVLNSSKEIVPLILRYENLQRPHQPLDFFSTSWMYHEHSKPASAKLHAAARAEGEDSPEETSEPTVIFRVTTSLPTNIGVGTAFQVLRPTFIPFYIPVYIDIQPSTELEYAELRGPNLKIPSEQRTGNDTILKSFDDLVGSNTAVKNQITNKYISGSNTIEMNHDYREYSDFIHFSSAAERLANFKYKITQIQHYESKSVAVGGGLTGLSQTAATGSPVLQDNKASYNNSIENIISTFDSYEKYLYNTSHSTETTSEGTTYNPATWPKQTSELSAGAYTLFSVTSSEAVNWYSDQYTTASNYDAQNTDMLRNTIPAYILADGQNSQYTLFYDMVGQHFDIMFNEIKSLEKFNERHESVDIGISKDMIYDAAKSFGWTLQSGFDTAELWETLLGTDESGGYQISGSGETLTYIKKESYSHNDLEKQTWKRILNNLPFLLKSKGTARGIRALLATYGIPNTILRVQEYGGPVSDKTSNLRAIEKFCYAVNFTGSTQFIQTEHGIFWQNKGNTEVSSLTTGESEADNYRVPSMYEVRLDTSETGSYIIARGQEHPGVGPRWEVRMEHSTSAAGWDSPSAIAAGSASMFANYGRFTFEISSSDGQPAISASTDYLPCYDNDWWNISFGVSEYPYWSSVIDQSLIPESQSFTIRVAKAAEHANKITHSSSATVVGNSSSYSRAYGDVDHVAWGYPYTDPTPGFVVYSGSMQEIRAWAEYLSDSAFHKHTLAPTSIVGDTVQMAYNDLLVRLPLGTDGLTYNHSHSAAGYTVTSSLPNLDNRKWTNGGEGEGGLFINWSSANAYSEKNETYYVDVPHTAGPRPHAAKIRVEDNSLRNNQLSRTRSFEVSSFDSNPLDTEDVSVTLSPADQIDTDIAMQFGGFSLDDYIGDPRDKYLSEYTSLRDTKNLYFKKYSRAYNVWEFIQLLRSLNVGLFRQIESMIPSRADAIVGIEIRPNLLERHKLGLPASMSQETMYYTSSISINKTNDTNNLFTFSADANSAQTGREYSFQPVRSEYLHMTAPIDIGVRSSQQGATGSYSYVQRFHEGSEYLHDVFGETTMSGVQTFVSKSATWSGGEDFKYNPTFNAYRPAIRGGADAPASMSLNHTRGSAGKRMPSLYPQSIDINPNYISSPAQRRLVIDGIQMTSPDFNVGSPHTIDGGPVAEYQLVNPNIVRVKSNKFTRIASQRADPGKTSGYQEMNVI